MKNDAILPSIRVPTADLAMYRRQAEAAGLSLAAWVRRALDRAAAAPGATLVRPDVSTSSLDALATDRVAALAARLGLRRGSDLAPAPRTPADRQRLDATVMHQLQLGTEPEAILALLTDSYSEPEIRAAIARRDSAA